MNITIRNRTFALKNLVRCMIKVNQPIRYESKIANRYPNYQMIYKFPLISVASIVNRLKLYHTIATGVGLSATAVLTVLNIIETEIATTFAATGLSGCAILYTLGYFGQDRVGIMYLKDDCKSVMISYTDFWGRRVDTDVDISDIEPLNDLPDTVFNSLHYNVKRYSTNKSLKFNIKYADIIDPEKFRLVFGNPSLVVKR